MYVMRWRLLFFLFSSFFVLCGCKGDYSERVLDLNDIEEIELNTKTSDINIVPIKCSEPMDGIRSVKAYDEYMFLQGTTRKKIYCFNGDSVISILESAGRGHGEYSYIDDFEYDEKTHILYVYSDGRLFKYSVPTMSFLESLDVTYSTIGMVMLNPDEILVNCSYWEDNSYKESYHGLCIVSSATGEIVKQCKRFGFYDEYCLMFSDLVRNGDDVLFPSCDVYNNRIYSMNVANDSLNEIDCFSFSNKWRLPKSLIKYARKRDAYSFESESMKRSVFCDGCHIPAIVNNRLVYWCYPEEDGLNKPVVIIKDKDHYINKTFKISGTKIRISPYYYHNNFFYKVINGAPESIITNPDTVSEFGKEIYEIMKTQAFNNPVLLLFTVDKGL